MGSMQADIRGIVSDIGHVEIYHVIFEGITNALQADATLVRLKINLDSNLFADEYSPCIQQIIIEDNGEGFTKENLESFKTYRSAYKNNMGCKGIGRFLYLKLFERVEILSAKTKVAFDFNGISDSKLRSASQTTQVCLLNPKDNFRISHITQRIYEHFLAYFQLEKKDIAIQIYQDDILIDTIKSSNRLDFKRMQFGVGDYDFLLSYIFGNSTLQSEGYYAANGRVVLKNSKLDSARKLKLSEHINILYIVESSYFDTNVNNERNDFDFLKKSELRFGNPSFSDIQDALNECINDICLQHDINIQEIISDSREMAIHDSPYLYQYLKNSMELSKDNMLKNAQKELRKDKEFLKNHKITAVNDTRLHRVMHAQLLEYSIYRHTIINILEKTIKRRDVATKIKEIFIHDNRASNAWIFDDRFIGYDTILTDSNMKHIFPKLYESLDNDSTLNIITNTQDKARIYDVLLIDFRRPEGGRNYFSRLSAQLLHYAMLMQNSMINNNIRIWAYGFLKFNDEIIIDLASDDYKQIHIGSAFPICYKYHSLHNAMINFIDYATLAHLAKTRHDLLLASLQSD